MKEGVVGIIPARGGSKGVPRKNIKLLNGKPLIYYTIKSAKEANCLSRVIVSTEDHEIAEVAKHLGSEVVSRPQELARDDTPTEPVLQQVVKQLEEKEGYEVSVVVLLQPTSPLRGKDDIDSAYKEFEGSKADSLLSVCERRHLYWREEKGIIKPSYEIENRPRRQEMKPWLQENGAIYITRREILMAKGNRLGGKIAFYVMDEERSIEVDTEFDFWMCEQILRKSLLFGV